MMKVRNRERGYSLPEMLTVVAIIAVLSMVTVPAFINYQRSQAVKNSLRQFTSDLRAARQRAVTRTTSVEVRIPKVTPTEDQRVYEIWESTRPFVKKADRSYGTDPISVRQIDKITWFTSDVAITFLPNGTVEMPANESTQTVTLDSANKFGKKSYVVTVSVSGRVSAE